MSRRIWTSNGKCFDCKVLDRECLSCNYGYYTKELDKCYKCKFEIKGELVQLEKCKRICSDENCLICYMFQKAETCYICKGGYRLENNKCIKCIDKNCISCNWDEYICTQCNDNSVKLNGRCIEDYTSNCIRFGLYHCKKCSKFKKCVECYDNYEIDKNGKCVEKQENSKNSESIALSIVISTVIFNILITILACFCICRIKNPLY